MKPQRWQASRYLSKATALRKTGGAVSFREGPRNFPCTQANLLDLHRDSNTCMGFHSLGCRRMLRRRCPFGRLAWDELGLPGAYAGNQVRSFCSSVSTALSLQRATDTLLVTRA